MSNSTHSLSVVTTIGAIVELFTASSNDRGITFRTKGVEGLEGISDGKSKGTITFSNPALPNGPKISFPFNITRNGDTVYVPGSLRLVQELLNYKIGLSRDWDKVPASVMIVINETTK